MGTFAPPTSVSSAPLACPRTVCCLGGFAEFAPAPDLAVEVLSPDDRERDLFDKVGEYLSAGVRLVWVVDPVKATAVVFRSLTDVRRIERDGTLDGEDVLPGFSCPLAQILT